MFSLESRDKPVLKWAGGKSGVLEPLVTLFPAQFRRYSEPFLGAGAVFLALRGDCPAILNDSNGELMDLYRVLRDHPGRLMAALDKLGRKYSERFYYRLRGEVPSGVIGRAARLVFLNKTGFNGLYRLNSKGEFNVPFGKRANCPALYDRENLLAVSQRLKAARLSCVDFEKVINEARKGDFVYCDPPYAPVSATSSFSAYTKSGFGVEDQFRLRNACVRAAKRGVRVAVSNSNSRLIRELYRAWNLTKIPARRAINSKVTARGKVSEWCATLGW